MKIYFDCLSSPYGAILKVKDVYTWDELPIGCSSSLRKGCWFKRETPRQTFYYVDTSLLSLDLLVSASSSRVFDRLISEAIRISTEINREKILNELL